ncbi:MAG: restriction endonuclease [Anaerolineae bacterium]|nr:restriction endonuclease [Anaerolineae bacterium]
MQIAAIVLSYALGLVVMVLCVGVLRSRALLDGLLPPGKPDMPLASRLRRLEEITALTPAEFERLVGELFAWQGYEVTPTPSSGDQGVDLFLRRAGRLSVVQCKRYQPGEPVGQPVVRDLYGVLAHHAAWEAYLVTSGSFSEPARSWAAGKPIRLVDGNQLAEWLEMLRSNARPHPDRRTLLGLALAALALLAGGALLGMTWLLVLQALTA